MIPFRTYDHDDDLIDRTRGDFSPRVRVYGWSGTAVVIGRGGKQELELNTAALAEDLDSGLVTFFKRRGGGCSVVLDPGNLIISLVLPVPGIGRITSSFDLISQWLITALDRCGVPAVAQEGVSDLVIGAKKIGGSCVYRTKNILYYSSTILVDPDLDAVDRYLCHPPREPRYRQGRDHRNFMGSLIDMALVADMTIFRRDLELSLSSSLSDLDALLPERQ